VTWQPVDCHAHSTFSDGTLTVEQIVARASTLGVRPSVSDHVSRDVAKAIDSVDAVRDYLDVLDRHDVLRGGEFCWHDDLWREIPADVVARFTHRIGSLHAIFLDDGTAVHAFSRHFPATLTTDAYMDAFVDNLERFAREMPVDILAHPTLVTLSLRQHDAERLWTEDREERVVEALFHAGIAFELSSRYPPPERLVRRAVDRGVRCSLGSDGHSPAQVADVARPLALARALGVADAELYDPTMHGSKTGAFDRSAVPSKASGVSGVEG
jgi:histidinol phosphatase-like PHP family hydrolase